MEKNHPYRARSCPQFQVPTVGLGTCILFTESYVGALIWIGLSQSTMAMHTHTLFVTATKQLIPTLKTSSVTSLSDP